MIRCCIANSFTIHIRPKRGHSPQLTSEDMIGQPQKSSVDGILVSDTLRTVRAALGCVLGSFANHGSSQGSKGRATWSPPALANHRIVEHKEGFNSWSTSFIWAIDIFPRYLSLFINVSNGVNHLLSNIFIPLMLQLRTAFMSVHQHFQGRLLYSPPRPNRGALIFTAFLKRIVDAQKVVVWRQNILKAS